MINILYRYILRPTLFLFSPETVHHLVGAILRFTWRLIPAVRTRGLEREVWGIKFRNPVGLAAGFDKDAHFFRAMGRLGFGFVEVGTVTPRAQPGNARPRCFRLPKDRALINRMGFNNHGLESMKRGLRHRPKGLVVGANLGKNSLTTNENAPADYLELFRGLYDLVDYFAINVSCPNVRDVTALQNRSSVMGILQPLFDYRRGQKKYRPIVLKISPDLLDSQVDEMTEILRETELDGIIATNTTTSREGLQTTIDQMGGLSGAPLTQRALSTVRRVCEHSGGKPVIGVGGIMSPRDARNMLEAGASLVQVYTGFIYEGPGFAKKICRYIFQK